MSGRVLRRVWWKCAGAACRPAARRQAALFLVRPFEVPDANRLVVTSRDGAFAIFAYGAATYLLSMTPELAQHLARRDIQQEASIGRSVRATDQDFGAIGCEGETGQAGGPLFLNIIEYRTDVERDLASRLQSGDVPKVDDWCDVRERRKATSIRSKGNVADAAVSSRRCLVRTAGKITDDEFTVVGGNGDVATGYSAIADGTVTTVSSSIVVLRIAPVLESHS